MRCLKTKSAPKTGPRPGEDFGYLIRIKRKKSDKAPDMEEQLEIAGQRFEPLRILPALPNRWTGLDDAGQADLPVVREMAINHMTEPDVLTDVLALRAPSPFD